VEIYTLLDKKWFSLFDRYKSIYETATKQYQSFAPLIDYLAEEPLKDDAQKNKNIKEDFMRLTESHDKLKSMVEGALNQSGTGLPTDSQFQIFLKSVQELQYLQNLSE
jgi:hypothetical protein